MTIEIDWNVKSKKGKWWNAKTEEENHKVISIINLLFVPYC